MIKVVIPLIVSLTALTAVLFLVYSKKQKKWEEMTPKEKRRKKAMILGGLAIFLSGIAAALSLGKKDRSKGDNDLA